jgi:hypothetical protein
MLTQANARCFVADAAGHRDCRTRARTLSEIAIAAAAAAPGKLGHEPQASRSLAFSTFRPSAPARSSEKVREAVQELERMLDGGQRHRFRVSTAK